ncbi:MAG: TatD family deoxyribonuclease [Thaumarchaeota archaeon]|nr:MAG: TatD family deoxyribonuclease [Nitrososphaerota archaeon]
MIWLTDVHIHLSDDEFSKDIPFILKGMDKLRIRACCVSVDLKSSEKTLELGQKSNLILPFVGIHPENASSNDLEFVVKLIEKNSKYISGIGEIGLDKTYVSDLDGFKNQELVFNKMLSIAEKLGKPVSIHSRATLDEILTILPSYSISGILLHWFAGSKKQLKTAMERNYFVSYGPAMVYAKDKQVLLSETNTERILVETDGPVKFSRCFGFKVGQIAFLPSVVFCAAKVLHISYDDMAYQIEENCKHYLGV